MDASSWDDKAILEKTVLEQHGAGHRLVLDLGDDNDPVVSDVSSPDELRKHMIAWCDGVRAEVKARSAREKAEALALAARVDVPVMRPIPPQQPAPQTPQNALEHATHQHEIAAQMLAEFQEQRANLDKRIDEVRSNVRVWGTIVEQFSKVIETEEADASGLPE